MISIILNLPWIVIGFLLGLLSIPKSIAWDSKHCAIIMRVKSFWWAKGYMKGARAAAIGNVVLLSPQTEDKDLEHEFVHVDQHQRMPLIQPILYYIELVRKGYRNNKYEVEAYSKAGNIYKE
jgi:hypothetical protein